jgi:hypothetical protein
MCFFNLFIYVLCFVKEHFYTFHFIFFLIFELSTEPVYFRMINSMQFTGLINNLAILLVTLKEDLITKCYILSQNAY